MKLREIMTACARTVRSDATLREAASLMRATGAGTLPVCDGERIVGTLSERDIVTRATALGRDPVLARVREAMTRDVAVALQDQSVEDAAALLAQNRARRLVVVDAARTVVGVVNAETLARIVGARFDGRKPQRGADRPAGHMLH